MAGHSLPTMDAPTKSTTPLHSSAVAVYDSHSEGKQAGNTTCCANATP
jgi:hypothetical protein